MATLKAIKNNYELLTKQERFGLYQKASLRRDDNELAAIYAATPMKAFKVIDFYFLREEIYRIDTVNMLQRLGYNSLFDVFSRFADEETNQKKSDDYNDHASLSAYLYVIETDAWQIVCDELGFEVNWFRKLAAEISFGIHLMETKDDLLRHFAFSEDEAKDYICHTEKRLKVTVSKEIKTLDSQIKFYRDFIDEI